VSSERPRYLAYRAEVGNRLLRGPLADVGLAVVVAAIVSITLLPIDTARPGLSGWLLMLCGAVALAGWRRFPVPTLFVIGQCTAFFYIGGHTASLGSLSFAVASFLAAAAGQRVAVIAGAVPALAAYVIAQLVESASHVDLVRIFAILGWVTAVIAAGEITRYHRAYVTEVKRRAEEAEHTKEEEGLRRATQERLRIARELHDVLAHNISLINVQAAAALHRREPERAYAALEAIKAASKETLRELRTTLGVLRQVDAAPLDPVPSLDRIGDLIGQTQAAGMPVRLTVSGDETPLPAEVELAAYRIVQEALTNAVRHAGPTKTTVGLHYAAGLLVVEIGDEGCGRAGTDEGNGIRGMRERAASVGGSVEVGPAPAGGFHVRAQLPFYDSDSAERRDSEPTDPGRGRR
jgi:signal transduction histidine kinase